jgi:hypothetical protein
MCNNGRRWCRSVPCPCVRSGVKHSRPLRRCIRETVDPMTMSRRRAGRNGWFSASSPQPRHLTARRNGHQLSIAWCSAGGLHLLPTRFLRCVASVNWRPLRFIIATGDLTDSIFAGGPIFLVLPTAVLVLDSDWPVLHRLPGLGV